MIKNNINNNKIGSTTNTKTKTQPPRYQQQMKEQLHFEFWYDQTNNILLTPTRRVIIIITEISTI